MIVIVSPGKLLLRGLIAGVAGIAILPGGGMVTVMGIAMLLFAVVQLRTAFGFVWQQQKVMLLGEDRRR